MTSWKPENIHKHMHVYSVDKQDLGHVSEIYEDSFLVENRPLFSKHRYFPYSQIQSVDDKNIFLILSADEAQEKGWERRPDYEDHPGDPTQLMYDRGHGIHDPFDETGPN